MNELRRTEPPAGRRLRDAPPYSLGRLTLASVVILVVSGIFLAFLYQPTAEGATASLERLHRPPSIGGVLHDVHRWSALLLAFLTLLHALRAWVVKAYRPPRELGWWIGILLLLLVFALGGTGYLLRWDIKAFSLMDLLVSNLSGTPVIGAPLIALLLGGTGEDVVPLSRGYAVHIWFLPTVLGLVLGLHLFVVARQGLSEGPSRWRRWQQEWRIPSSVRWLPALLLLMGVVLLSVSVTIDKEGIAAEAISPWPLPDWLLLFYFLPFWFFRGELRVVGTLVIPAVVLLLLFVAPRIDSNRMRRSVSLALAALGFVGVGLLLGQTARMGSQVPIAGCSACHRPSMVGGAPRTLSEFDIRDPDWLVFHLQEPVESILTPLPKDEVTP